MVPRCVRPCVTPALPACGIGCAAPSGEGRVSGLLFYVDSASRVECVVRWPLLGVTHRCVWAAWVTCESLAVVWRWRMYPAVHA